jgi:hypothetical protein
MTWFLHNEQDPFQFLLLPLQKLRHLHRQAWPAVEVSRIFNGKVYFTQLTSFPTRLHSNSE